MDHHNEGNIFSYLLDSKKMTLTGTTSYHMDANPARNVPELRLIIPSGTGSVAGGNVAGGNVAGGANPLPVHGLTTWGNAHLDWGNPNQPAGTRANGPLRINDPYAQSLSGYRHNGTNQPLARNIGMALEHQEHTLTTKPISRYVFSQNDQIFLLQYLYHNDSNLYNKVVRPRGDNITVEIWKLPNTLKLRNSLNNIT